MHKPEINGGSPEAVAYALLVDVDRGEHGANNHPNKQWILDTYAECLDAVKQLRPK